MHLISAKSILDDARKNNYAVGHFNLNNTESVIAFLLAAQEAKAPIILGVSGGTAKYMGGYRTIADSVTGYINFLKISVPVALHVDHGTFAEATQAIEEGFSSVMYDGSALPIEENLKQTEIVLKLARAKGISVEAEVGVIGGEEDGVVGSGEWASPEHCRMMADLGVDCLAAGIGNIHGRYPKDWQGLNFGLLQEISDAVGSLPLVLHGGSQIPVDQITRSIDLGISKINVNTEAQIAFTDA
ncbi:MAG TPA: ketose-bisphosphate aldolase, partial [Sphaerochaeta sp.]|nr:ketose-bisphosphate aldolase [Sphaerochaeta sp.]